MQFKDIKPGCTICLVDTRTMELTNGKVTNTSFPYPDNQSGNNNFSGGLPNYSPNQSSGRMVLDLTIEANGRTATYTVSETASINYANHLMIASDQNSLLPELQSLADESEKIIAAAPAHEERLKKIKELQVELNPQAKREQEYDKRLAAIEKSQQDMAAMITNFIKEFKS